MKKIYISVDTEGLNGITSFKQVLPEYHNEYAQMLPQLHLELNALIKGLKRAGINEIIVNDAHNTMTNLSLAGLPDDIILIAGKPKKISMMYGLDESFDGVIFLAYHSKATASGVLAHTFNMYFKSVKLNGVYVSEADLNAIYATNLHVPIILATGDDVFCQEIKGNLGKIETITTKTAINATAAICRKNNELLQEYELKGERIKTFTPCFYELPSVYELIVELESENVAQKIAEATNIPFSKNELICKSEDYTEIYLNLQKMSAALTLYKIQSQQV